jgi:hypothetical protein
MTQSYEQLARQAFPGPAKHIGKHEMRFGRRGSVSVCLLRGVYYNHEKGEGGLLKGARPLSAEERAAWEAEKAANDRDRQRRAQRLWNRCQPARGTLVEAYLRHRGLVLPPTDDIRFNPRCWHDPREEVWPAMVTAVRDRASGRVIGAHRTYLARDGRRKAPFADPEHQRRLLGSQRDGAAFVLGYDASPRWVNAGESVEEAIAIWMLTGAYSIGLLNAGVMGRFRPYGACKTATLFLNHDQGGRDAGQKAAVHWRGIKLLLPGARSSDWNDLVKHMRVVAANFDGEIQPGVFPYQRLQAEGRGYQPRSAKRRRA